MTRFDVDVLTVEPDGDAWVAVIEEKLELVPSDGGATAYSALDHAGPLEEVRRPLDGALVGGRRHESWRNGEKPPLRDW